MASLRLSSHCPHTHTHLLPPPPHPPGNAGEAQKQLQVKCWDQKKSVVVKIIDICPCYYEPQGQKPYYQYGCCYKEQNHMKAGQIEFDLSFWVSATTVVQTLIKVLVAVL